MGSRGREKFTVGVPIDGAPGWPCERVIVLETIWAGTRAGHGERSSTGSQVDYSSQVNHSPQCSPPKPSEANRELPRTPRTHLEVVCHACPLPPLRHGSLLPRAQLPEVLGGAGADVREEHRLYPPLRRALDGHIQEDEGQGGVGPQGRQARRLRLLRLLGGQQGRGAVPGGGHRAGGPAQGVGAGAGGAGQVQGARVLQPAGAGELVAAARRRVAVHVHVAGRQGDAGRTAGVHRLLGGEEGGG